MKLQLIRNATLVLEFGGKRFLIDPMLGEKHQFRSFAEISENPTVDMPLPAADLLAHIDAVIVSHLHPDHFDEAAQKLIPKNMPILCDPAAFEPLQQMGFSAVTAVAAPITFAGVKLTPTAGEHGYGAWAERMGAVSGYLFRAVGEPTVYWCGDTVLVPAVEQVLAEAKPDIVITHSGGAQFGGPEGLILMDAAQTVRVAQLAPQAKIVATHLEALDHCTVSREALRQAAENADLGGRILIPADGEMLEDLG